MAFAYFLYLYNDIRQHIFHAKNERKGRLERKELIKNYVRQNDVSFFSATVIFVQTNMYHILLYDTQPNANRLTNEDANYVRTVRQLDLPPIEDIPHRYCFVTSRNGESFYIKLGASCELTFEHAFGTSDYFRKIIFPGGQVFPKKSNFFLEFWTSQEKFFSKNSK